MVSVDMLIVQSYLSEQKYRVKLGNYFKETPKFYMLFSSPLTMTKIVIGPTFFLIYINKLCNLNLFCCQLEN